MKGIGMCSYGYEERIEDEKGDVLSIEVEGHDEKLSSPTCSARFTARSSVDSLCHTRSRAQIPILIRL